MTTDVLLYTTNWCPFCRRAKALLKEKGVRWKELDIEADPAHRQAMAEASGRATRAALAAFSASFFSWAFASAFS